MNRRSVTAAFRLLREVPGAEARSGAERSGWWSSARLTFACALAVGLMMSAQMLFQPFVWRNWPWDDVLLAWLQLSGRYIWVAELVAVSLVLASRIPARSRAGHAALLASSIAMGAAAGQESLGYFGIRPEQAFWPRFVQWNLLAISVTAMVYLWKRSGDVREAARAVALRQAQIEQQRVVAQLQALRSQIEPHFLFNTLATLRSLQRNDPREGADLVAYLLDYLRSAGPEAARDDSTLGEELALVRAYLGVVGLRMPGRLAVEIDVDAALLACEMPGLVIATLIENAVKHGIAPAPAGGGLSVTAKQCGDLLEVCVCDTGVGFGGELAGSGLGLANVRARLQTLYGARGRLKLAENRPHGVCASIQLPLRHAAGCA